MSVEGALLAAVGADPDDDLRRLVHADWLEEHDQPQRAAFIRSQIDYARAEPFSPAARAARPEQATGSTRGRWPGCGSDTWTRRYWLKTGGLGGGLQGAAGTR